MNAKQQPAVLIIPGLRDHVALHWQTLLAEKLAASREVLQGGTWVAAPVQAATVQKLEDIILTKARDLRRSAIG